MPMKKYFIIAQGEDETRELRVVPQCSEKTLTKEGYAFGTWLLDNSATSFLRGLARALDEAEIRKKVGLGF